MNTNSDEYNPPNKLKSNISAENQCKFINKILNSIHEEIRTKSDRIKTFAEINKRALKNRNPRDWKKTVTRVVWHKGDVEKDDARIDRKINSLPLRETFIRFRWLLESD